DGTRGVVWAYGKGRLSSYRIDGTLLFSKQIPFSTLSEDQDEQKEDEEFDKPGWAYRDERHPQLALDPQDGAVWLARGRVLQRVNATGQVEKTIPFEKKILAISVDSVRSRVWVTVQGARMARAFAASGAEVASLDPKGRGRVTDLAFDPVLDRLWLTLNQQEIASFTPEGEPDFRKPGLRFKPGWLTPDGYGGAWFADDGQT
ncbi:MAG: hypothetical protein H7833_21290, partial [Magnetococcus sp. DMHC-1]